MIDSVKLGAGMHIECWMGYRGLRHVYAHEMTKTKRSRETASELFPHIHRMFSLLKRVLLGT